MQSDKVQTARVDASADQAPGCRPAPKWVAVVNDQLIPMPQRHVKASVIREQGGVSHDHVLVRDHNSPNDTVIPENAMVDLADGNVFYSEPACDVKSRPKCAEPPKLAYAVDDRWEIVIRPAQTGHTVRDLFGLPADVELLRDYESPSDQIVGDDAANFGDGPVFRTRKRHDLLTIIVNKKPFTTADGVKPEMTGREIATLVFPDPNRTAVFKVEGNTDKPIGLDDKIKIVNCDEFKVIRHDVVAGFQATRVERELAVLRAGGAAVTLLSGPIAAVIYHDVPAREGLPVTKTDVLVKLPGGYPGTFLDNAYLPAGSPLLGKVPGAVQGGENIGDQSWRLISIHPHHPNGTAWNKDRHGLHTYYDEILSWLNKRP